MAKRTNTAKWLESQKRWQINVQQDGRRRTFTSTKPGRAGQREANAKADAWLEDGIDQARVRVDQLLDGYLETVKKRTGTGNYQNEEYRCRVWLRPRIGHLQILRVSEQDLQAVIDDAFAKGLSRKSLTNLRATIMAFFKYCRKCRATTFYPENIDIPKGAPVARKQILQPDDLITLFTVETTLLRGKRAFDDYIYAYRFQVLTGLRPGELLGLMWSDISGDTVQIRRSINILGEITTGKNENAIRSFVLSPAAQDVLEKQRAISKSIYVFRPIMEDGYRKRWQRYCEANGIQKITPYEMRHTFVSIAKNLPEGQLKALVGHSRSMDTYGTYSHQIQGEQQETARRLEEIFAQLLPPAQSK